MPPKIKSKPIPVNNKKTLSSPSQKQQPSDSEDLITLDTKLIFDPWKKDQEQQQIEQCKDLFEIVDTKPILNPGKKETSQTQLKEWIQSMNSYDHEQDSIDPCFEMDEDVLKAIEHSLLPPTPNPESEFKSHSESESTESKKETPIQTSEEHEQDNDSQHSEPCHPSWQEKGSLLEWPEIRKKIDTTSTTKIEEPSTKNYSRDELFQHFQNHPMHSVLSRHERLQRWTLQALHKLLTTKIIYYSEKHRIICIVFSHNLQSHILRYGASIWKKENSKEIFDRKEHCDTAMFRYMRKPIIIEHEMSTTMKQLHKTLRKYLYKHGVCT
jgi:hypothetical protein